MPKSLAEMRQSPHVGLAERTFTICVAGKLAVEYQQIRDAYLDALAQEKGAAEAEEDGKGSTMRVGERPKSIEFAEQLDALADKMAEHEVALRIRAKPDADWRAFKRANPPKDSDREDRIAGYDFDALINSVADYLVPEACEPALTNMPADWEFVRGNASARDLHDLAAMIHNAHETSVDVPKSRMTSQQTRPRSDG